MNTIDLADVKDMCEADDPLDQIVLALVEVVEAAMPFLQQWDALNATVRGAAPNPEWAWLQTMRPALADALARFSDGPPKDTT